MTAADLLVAIVDDDKPFRDAVGSLMRVSGFKAQTYASGRELLESRQLAQIGLVLLDVQMREMSGLDLVRHLRALGRRTPVIFVTGTRDPQTRAAILDQQASILVKPFDPDELVAMVQAVLGS